MSADEDRAQAAFPSPPARFYKAYTDEAVRNGEAPAPPRIPEGTYSTFGATFQVDEEIIRPLESQGIRQLVPNDHRDRIGQMRKLHHSILVNFLDLLDVLIRAPSSPKRDEKLNDLNLLFINLHHVINEFRPHQALETVRAMMERQRRQREQAISDLQRHMDAAKATLQQCTPTLSQLQQPAELVNGVVGGKEEAEADVVAMDTDPVPQPGVECSEDVRLLCDRVDLIT